MNIKDLLLINKNKVIPFYYLDIGKDFRMPMEVRGTHLCPYTKVDLKQAICQCGSQATVGTTLIRPL
jgi:hypothetical protein